MGMNNEFNYRSENPVQIRTCPYLNNFAEQDHRRVKSRVGPMLGFKRFFNARRVVAGVELVHYRTLVLCRTPTGGSESERKGAQKNAGTMPTKRIFTMVMPGKIIA